MTMQSTIDKIKQILHLSVKKDQLDRFRTVVVNKADPLVLPQAYLSNSVSTSKYTVYSFVLKFLYEQFSKYANLFFLFTACIQQIDGVSPTSRYTTIVPLLFVLVASAAKEMVEDFKRHKSDEEVNNRMCHKLQSGSFVQVLWKDLQVGDIIKVTNENYFPADLVLLSSSEPEGLCYIETSSLDGETNLKIKQSRQETCHILTAELAQGFQAELSTELPNSSLYTFDGTMIMSNGGQQKIPLDPSQILLRGAMLRNTAWVYGVVVFTGHDCKLMQNSTAAPIKQSRVEKMTNRQIVMLFIILLLMSVCSAAGQLAYLQADQFSYLYPDGLSNRQVAANFFLNILTFIILYNNLIPISLIVTMEVVKLVQSRLIGNDLDIYNPKNDTPTVVRTSSLVEELGQVDYIFSDKTGTLTCNEMEFLNCTVAGTRYDLQKGVNKTFADLSQVALSNEGSAGQACDMFLTILSVCHTVIPEMVKPKDGSSDQPKIKYQSSSPDEAALVDGAAGMSYVFKQRRPSSLVIEKGGKEVEYQVLNICEFNSTRKRMSAVVRFPDGRIVLLIKGADTVIFERLSKAGENVNLYFESVNKELEVFALEGLRTLCFAYREIPEQEYDSWVKVFNDAATCLTDRSQKLDEAAELIEKDLILVGASAIEDKLQQGVPDTIHTLADAGIKIWVLTGDRQETAINIGYSCKLLTQAMSLVIIEGEDEKEVNLSICKKLDIIKDCMKKYKFPLPEGRYDPALSKQSKGSNKFRDYARDLLYSLNGAKKTAYSKAVDSQSNFVMVDLGTGGNDDLQLVHDEQNAPILALVIDGKTLKHALQPNIALLFLQLATLCKSVICCRVSPLQKALVVKLVKDNMDAVTLAIGDGANDVSMIQSAHIGVGISGNEGLQAARSSDIAISQFKYLQKLVLVHGAWSYARLSKLILFSFYKNITLYMTQLWFAFYNGFSGQTIYESWTISLYNVIFTVLPPLFIGVFDQYLSARVLGEYPQLYKSYQKKEFFNLHVFWGWVMNAIYHSLLLYFITYIGITGGGFALGDGPYQGTMSGMWLDGTLLYSCVLMTVLLKAAYTLATWNKYTTLAIVGSFVSWIVFLPIYSIAAPANNLSMELNGITPPLYGSGVFWFSLILVPGICILRDVIWKYAKRMALFKDYHIVQEIQRYGTVDHSPQSNNFKRAVKRLQKIQKFHNRGYAFSQNESGMADIVKKYDTLTLSRPSGN
ncbi:hypothetical protein MIR68_006733 [Amoeboaphelidium protococcarum]|nr:hypothetical protein MIR68_006733 [Amoeboaphelidium protococcarum]